jgi:hypothetical protein
MYPDDYELIRRLCTKTGTLMEDMSVTAIVNSGFSPELIEQTLSELTIAASQIAALIDAARAVNGE